MSIAVARVYVNDVGVGALPADQYKTIVDEIGRDRKIYLAQALNFYGVILRGFSMLLKIVPFMLFYILCIGILFSPESISAIVLAEIQRANIDECVQTIRQIIIASIVLSIVVLICASLLSNYRYGYVNQFDNEINKRIRDLLEVPAAGHMRVTIVDGDSYHVQ